MPNQLKTVFFLGALAALIIWFGGAIGGTAPKFTKSPLYC